MEFNEYQNKAMTTCMPSCKNFSYMMLNLVGEVGELSSKVAKQIRKGHFAIYPQGHQMRIDDTFTLQNYADFRLECMKEAGDILWQLSGLCSVMGWDLEKVAQMNLKKLAARKAAGTIDGSGDGIERPK